MPPDKVVALLNRYFHIMEEIIFRHGGTIDKFGGDSIMAFWGVLVRREFDAIGAVAAAVEMQNALFAFNCELRSQGLPPVRMGIGLNTGEFVAGNIGSEQKIEFTVIGDAVNNWCGLCKRRAIVTFCGCIGVTGLRRILFATCDQNERSNKGV